MNGPENTRRWQKFKIRTKKTTTKKPNNKKRQAETSPVIQAAEGVCTFSTTWSPLQATLWELQGDTINWSVQVSHTAWLKSRATLSTEVFKSPIQLSSSQGQTYQLKCSSLPYSLAQVKGKPINWSVQVSHTAWLKSRANLSTEMFKSSTQLGSSQGQTYQLKCSSLPHSLAQVKGKPINWSVQVSYTAWLKSRMLFRYNTELFPVISTTTISCLTVN